MNEVDSDVNEDSNRERQLDESYEEWYAEMKDQIHQQEEITRVPMGNVFEAAEDIEAEDR